MDRWASKVAVITGAASGMGLAISKLLLENGMIVIGLDVKLGLMEVGRYHKFLLCKTDKFRLFKERMSGAKELGKFYAKKCDVIKEEQVKMVFAWIRDTFNNVHVLVNSAGILRPQSLIGETENTKSAMSFN